jgi:hypothetical protein
VYVYELCNLIRFSLHPFQNWTQPQNQWNPDHYFRSFFSLSQWNERLFHEMYLAWLSGKIEKDPSLHWYEGEIGFFDFYIIPLAKKLKECGVFGACSAEYLTYAVENRQEWARKGKSIVQRYVETYGQKDQSMDDAF